MSLLSRASVAAQQSMRLTSATLMRAPSPRRPPSAASLIHRSFTPPPPPPKEGAEEEGEGVWKPPANIRQMSLVEDPKLYMSRVPGMVKDGLYHTWLGTKLLVLNVWTASNLGFKALRGNKLSRRERRLLVNTAADIFRLVPFSFFVIIPAAELSLPFFLKFFPNMLPSTFTSKDEEEEKLYKKVKARLEMAKFLQQTAESLKSPSAKFEKNFKEVIDDIKSGQPVSKEQVYKFVTLFKDDLTLANLKRSQIMHMCRFIGIRPYGPTDYLRGQLSARIDALKKDDKMIKVEGLSSLSLIELKQAVAARGMASYAPRKQLEALMEEWLDLSLNQKVPTALLILSRAYRLLPHQNPDDLLKATLTKVPEKVLEEAEVDAKFTSGAEALQEKIDLLKEERKKLKEEAKQKSQSEAIGAHHPIDADARQHPTAVQDDITKVVSATDALDALANPIADEKAELSDIGAKLLENEILNKEKVVEAKAEPAEKQVPEKKESKIEKHLESKIKEMVKAIDSEIKEAEARIIPSFDLDGDGVVTKEEMRAGLERLGNLSTDEIETIVQKLDADHDGIVQVDDITAVSHLEADLKTMTHVVVEEEKKRLETLREKVEEIIEVEKQQDKAAEAAKAPEKEVKEGTDMKEKVADPVAEEERKVVDEVREKEATAPPVSPPQFRNDAELPSSSPALPAGHQDAAAPPLEPIKEALETAPAEEKKPKKETEIAQ